MSWETLKSYLRCHSKEFSTYYMLYLGIIDMLLNWQIEGELAPFCSAHVHACTLYLPGAGLLAIRSWAGDFPRVLRA